MPKSTKKVLGLTATTTGIIVTFDWSLKGTNWAAEINSQYALNTKYSGENYSKRSMRSTKIKKPKRSIIRTNLDSGRTNYIYNINSTHFIVLTKENGRDHNVLCDTYALYSRRDRPFYYVTLHLLQELPATVTHKQCQPYISLTRSAHDICSLCVLLNLFAREITHLTRNKLTKNLTG